MMARVEPQNLPTYVVWQRPGHVEEARLGNEPFFWGKVLQQPVLHFWVYREIVRGLKRRVFKKGKERGREHLIPVDVCFPPRTYESLEALYEGDNVLRQMGRWLTEQMMSSALVRESDVEGVVVRCVYVEEGKRPSKRDWIPLRWWEKAGRRLETWMLGGNEENVPFWLVFPSPTSEREPAVKIVEITRHRGRVLHRRGRISFPQVEDLFPDKPAAQNLFRKTYPLVSEGHITLMPVVFPYDQLEVVYLRHNGNHETWLYGLDVISGNLWNMAAKDSWIPLESGNVVLLGRLAHTRMGAMVVPGSLLFEIQIGEEG